MADRPEVAVRSPSGGWPPPWADVAEIESVLPHEHWSLIGGLMAQLWGVHHRIAAVRPTRDVDMLVHAETARGRASTVAAGLHTLGYELIPPVDPRGGTAHRFVRGRSVVDVVVADHAAPRALSSLLGHRMVRVDGGTQALRRTVNATLDIVPGRTTTVSVPEPFGALNLKSAAHRSDSRNPGRHLRDAAVLLACIDDPFEDRVRSGSDRSRLLYLQRILADPRHDAWRALPEADRLRAQDTLAILCDARSSTQQ